MKLLVIGGTVFLGRHLVEAALARGHEVTLFHRGRENPHLFPEAERILGDRGRDLALLHGRRFDAVMDTCGYLPEHVAASAQALTGAELYAYVSSVAVYSDLAGVTDEHAPVRTPEPELGLSAATFGALKVACEEAVRARFGARALIVRPGLVVGPHDVASRGRFDVHNRHVAGLDYDAFSARFPYWPLRFASGGTVLVPGRPEAPVQVLDVRDLAAWMVSLLERALGGTYNATGAFATMGELMKACARDGAERVWVDDAFLLARQVYPFVELPFWIPPGDGLEALMRVPSTAARQNGLVHRPLEETVAAVRAWALESPLQAVAPETPVLDRGRERELLWAWRQTSRKGSVENDALSPAKMP